MKAAKYIPGLHTEMNDEKKVLRYTTLMEAFPSLDGKTANMKCPLYRANAIAYVNEELAYLVRDREIQKEQYEHRKKKREEQKKKEEPAHIAELQKSLGIYWFLIVE